MKKSEWLDCQRNEFFPKQRGIPSLVKIEHKNTATLDSARSKKKSKVAVLQLHHRQPLLNHRSSSSIPLKPLRSDSVSFWFLGYRGDLRMELQAPLVESSSLVHVKL